MRKLKAVILGICILVAPYPVVAADFDGSLPLLCAVTDAMECGPESGCERSSVETLNLPQFLRIDFESKQITATKASGITRVSAIKNFERMEGSVIMQGAENGRGWSMVIREETGKMSATAAGEQVGFVVFGACIPD